jgi:hypothetical protein
MCKDNLHFFAEIGSLNTLFYNTQKLKKFKELPLEIGLIWASDTSNWSARGLNKDSQIGWIKTSKKYFFASAKKAQTLPMKSYNYGIRPHKCYLYKKE